MPLPVLQWILVPRPDFVDFWSRQYSYENDYLYNDNIGRELTEERVWALFRWKNGTPLSEKKKASVRKNFIGDRTEIPRNRNAPSLSIYLSKPGGAIWRIFWLHCNCPQTYPMYDQHVHRAMASLKGWEDIEIPFSNERKVQMYLTEYLPFWDDFPGLPPKMIDEALWSYGKFLKLGYAF